ncbi:MAG: PAS domain S-box protein [Promethearchaeota archaeon]
MAVVKQNFIYDIKEKYTDLFNFSPYLIYIHDLEGNLLLANDITIRSLGYKKKSLLKLNLSDIIDKDSYSIVKKMIREITNVSIINFLVKTPVEFELINCNNNKIYVEAFSMPIKEINKTKAILVIAKDIYKRKSTENKLEESEKKYRTMIDNLDVGFYKGEYKGRLLMHNRAANKILGIDQTKNLIGTKSIDFFVNPKEREKYYELLMNNGFVKHFIAQFKRPNGEYIFCEINAHLIDKIKGKPKEIDGTFMNITEKFRLEQKLRESESKYKNLVNKSPNLILLTDLKGKIVECNDTANKILGDREKIKGNLIFNIFKVDRIKRFFNLVVHVGKTTEDEFELEFKTLGGLNYWLNLKLSLISWIDKQFVHVIGQDITERKKHDEWRNNFIVRASHEIKSPLIGICGGAEKVLETYKKTLNSMIEIQNNVQSFLRNIIEEENYLDVISKLNSIYGESNIYDNLIELEEYIKMYDTGARRMKNLTEELLNYSIIESGKFELNKKNTDISKLMRDCIYFYKFLIEERKIRISQEIPNQLFLNLDESKMRLVFENLLTNAIKYTPIGGKIFIAIENDNNRVKIIVRDNGIGLNENEKKKIFEKFGKINKEGTHILSDGIGIGLYISKSTVELHGGTIKAESLGKNKGSSFLIELPV